MPRRLLALAIAFLVPAALPAHAGPRWTVAGTPLLSVGGGADSGYGESCG